MAELARLSLLWQRSPDPLGAIRAGFLLLACLLVVRTGVAQVQPDSSAADVDKPFFLPLLGDKAREQGIDLPLALGLGANFIFITRPTTITKVEAGINNEGLRELNHLAFDAVASVRTWMVRLDAWVLPFLNVYGLGGYIWNTSRVDMTVDLPGAPDTPVTSTGDLEGPVFGGGATLAGGYKMIFASIDANITHSQLDELSEFIAGLYSARIGWNGRIGDTPARVYAGAEYWDTKRTISGSIEVPDNDRIESVQFAVDQEPVDPLTVLVGTSITVSPSFWLMLEIQGWQDTQVLIGGATFRFPK